VILYPSPALYPSTTLWPGFNVQPSGARAVTLRGRAAAERLMTDECVVTHTSGSTVDPDTGVITPTQVTVYAGPCKVQQGAPAANPAEVGEAAVFIGQLSLHLPVNDASAAVAPDDRVAVTVCGLDASLVGKTFRLRGPAHKSYATARRFPMVETSG
jgi:hypothetical protein